MKRNIFIIFIFIFIWMNCEAGQVPKSKIILKTKDCEGIIFMPLSEDELQKLLKVFPEVKEDFENARMRSEQKLADQMNSIKSMNELIQLTLSRYINLNKEISGIEERLKNAGMPWNEFWPAYEKTIATHGMLLLMAMTLDDGSGNKMMEEETIQKLKELKKECEIQLKNPSISPLAKEQITGTIQLIEFYFCIPKENGKLIEKYDNQIYEILEPDFP